ncbi:integrase catalytic domain-containing protein, partial [Trichonephila clavipes]
VVGVTSLTFEELSTLSSQIEACLNSRPLCVLSSSPDDPCVLTPGHFLIGKALTAIPQPTVPDDLRHCDRWRLLTRMTQHFWNRWSSEYLTLLQSRSKWRIVQKNLDIGDLVLIKHDNSPPTTAEIRESHGNIPLGVLPQNWGRIDPNRSVIRLVLKATANDRRLLALCHDEFRGPRSVLCRSGDIGNNNNKLVTHQWIVVTLRNSPSHCECRSC